MSAIPRVVTGQRISRETSRVAFVRSADLTPSPLGPAFVLFTDGLFGIVIPDSYL